MNIVGISACAVGIAHTYMAAEAITKAAEKAGDTIHMETQGTIGVENELTAEQIASADIVIFAVDVKISDEKRFSGKKIVKVPTEMAIKSPNKLVAKLHELAGK